MIESGIKKKIFSLFLVVILLSSTFISYSSPKAFGATGPTISPTPPAGTYSSPQSVTLTASAPSTIFYTTDGSTPTTSSTNSPSPVSGITISTNSTLKFFAKDSLGNVGPTGSAVYTIILPPTVSASPLGGTYSLPQTISLTASRASTIFYTTDGSTPTTSSTNGPSPLSGITISTNSTLKFFAKDSLGNVGPIGSAQYMIIWPVVIQMNDTTPSFGLSTYSSRQVQAEYVSSTSSLVGKSIDTIVVNMKKVGLPSSTIQVGVFNSDRSVKQLFGTFNASSVNTSYTQYSFSLPAPQTYQIQSGDIIGIKFTGGDISNYIAIMTDSTNKFDGTNSYLTYYTTSWQSLTASDLYMILKLHVYPSSPTVSPTPPAGTYSSPQSVTLAASTPSTIFYTTDGSTPTTSSTNGPSPVSGITISTNSTLKFFAKDSSGNVGPIGSAQYTIVLPVVIQMNDTTSSFGYSTNVGRPIQTEYISGTSSLVGKSIDTIIVNLERVGSPSGTVQVGVFNIDGSVKQLFGSTDASFVTDATYAPYSFSLPSPQTYQIQSGDRIGIKFTGGDISNYIAIMTDQNNSFDGTNSYLTYFSFIWQPAISQDYDMTLELTHFSPAVITVTGLNPMTTAKGGTYVDPGAKAFDTTDGNLTSSIIKNSNVNTSSLGSYTVNYTVTDSHGFISKATRQVQVTPDTIPPAITIRGANPAIIQLHSTYVDAGATAIDNVAGNLTSSIVTQSTVNTSLVGNYTVTYTSTDNSGNTAHAVRAVSVLNDTSAPVITLKGSNPLTVGRGVIYLDPGATAFDSNDGNLTRSITTINKVNTGVVGTYSVTYNVSDPIGNAAQTVTRTVNVIDTSPVVAMNDSINTYGLSLNSARPIMAEYVSSTSTLVGKSIDSIIVTMEAKGAPTGPVQVGVFNNDLSVKQLFGAIDASNVTNVTYIQYTFSLPPFQTYQIQSGDIIGVKFTGGSGLALINVMTDQINSFDGTNSYLTYYYNGAWSKLTSQDITMALERVIIPTDLPTVTPPSNILSVTTNSSRNIPNTGTPAVYDKNDPSPVITNNSTQVFPVGNTTVLWRATDSLGNIGVAYQKVGVISVTPPPASQYNRVAMINFDDSYSSIYTLGKPILDKYGIKTTQYVICGRVDSALDYMNWNMVHAMQADGQDIEAHTMTHPNSNLLTAAQLTYEYGKDMSCFTNNGTSGVHMVAMPYNDGYDNATVINTISKYYDMARGGNDVTFFLHCNNIFFSTQSDCKTYNSQGIMNQYNRYNIRGESMDVWSISDNFNDAQTLSQFVQMINAATTNTSFNSTEIPIIYFHRVVQDNAAISDPKSKGTTTAVLDAAMKYLVDNNFKIRTTKDLGYDPVNNWFYLITPCTVSTLTDWTVSLSCTLLSSATAPANVIINKGAVLTIPSGVTLTIHFKTNHLLVHNGGGVLIKSGGAIN